MSLAQVKAVLFDLDGVLYVGSWSLPGAIEAVARVRLALPCRFVTNTSTQSLASLETKLAKLGFVIPGDELISAPQAAKLFLQQMLDPVCHLLLAEDVKRDFADFRQGDTQADVVLVGDIGGGWNYDLMNRVFKLLVGGAELIAIHKNRFWETETGLRMDIGGFVAALEYASNKPARIIGKPSADFFRMALHGLDVSPEQVAIVGDDIDADIGGAQAAGLRGILVKTGKYREEYAEASSVTPDAVIDSVKDLPGLLGC